MIATKKVISWSFYDWANSAFATSVMAGFFPVFFKQYWSAGVQATTSTFRLGLANSAASLMVAALAPALGAIADKGGVKMKFLLFFALTGIIMTGGMCFVGQGAWQAAVLFFVLGIIGFSVGNVFYDSLIVNVSPAGKTDMVSSLGFALGYLGGGVLFAINILMTLKPTSFGLTDAGAAGRVSFLSVAVWWAIFSIPIMIFVHEPPAQYQKSGWAMVGAGFPIVISLLGENPELSSLLSTTALAYGFGYMGMILSPVHVCLIVTNEHFKTGLTDSLIRLLKPALVVFTGTLLIYFIVRWIF